MSRCPFTVIAMLYRSGFWSVERKEAKELSVLYSNTSAVRGGKQRYSTRSKGLLSCQLMMHVPHSRGCSSGRDVCEAAAWGATILGRGCGGCRGDRGDEGTSEDSAWESVL